MGENSRQPSSLAQGGAIPTLLDTIPTFAAGANVGSAADPRICRICPTKTRIYKAWLQLRGTASAQAANNFYRVRLYNVSAAGVVGGVIFDTGEVITVPATVSKLVQPVNLGAPVPTYYDIEAGGGIGVFIEQAGSGDASDLSGGQNVEIHASLAPSDIPDVVGS